MVIIGLLASYVGPKYFGQIGKSEVKTAQAQIDAAYNTLFAFSDDVNGLGGGFSLGDGFSLTSFSTGQFLGTGFSIAVPAQIGAVCRAAGSDVIVETPGDGQRADIAYLRDYLS